MNKLSIQTNTESRNQKTFHDLLSTEIKFFEKKFGPKEKESFYSGMGLLLQMGVNIKTAFDILEPDFKTKAHQKIIINIKQSVIAGRRLHDSLREMSEIFSVYECESIKIGEETGMLFEVLKDLGLYFQDSIKLKRQMVGIMTYPIAVSAIAICTVYFMLVFVVPIFSEIFHQSGKKLPAITEFLISVSNQAPKIFTIVVLFFGASIWFHKLNKEKLQYRKITSKIILKIPAIGELVRKIYLARFCQSMRLLSKSKVTLDTSLPIVAKMIRFYPIENALDAVRISVVEKGYLLHESLSKHSIFPSRLIALIQLGEEVNLAEQVFEKLQKQFSDEIEHQQAVINKLAEPIFILALGLFVGFILAAMYLPMFELSNTQF